MKVFGKMASHADIFETRHVSPETNLVTLVSLETRLVYPETNLVTLVSLDTFWLLSILSRSI